MLRNYLTVASRNLRRNLLFTLINVVGLGLGIVCSLLILLWVQDELRFDAFHAQGESLFRVKALQLHQQGAFATDATPAMLGASLEQEFGEVSQSLVMSWEERWILRVGNSADYETGTFANEAIFTMLSFPLLEGNPRTVLSLPTGIVLSEKLAKKYFGAADPVGKTVRLDNRLDFLVSGVFKDIPPHSSLQFDYVIPFALLQKEAWARDWNAIGPETFVRLRYDADAGELGRKIRHYLDDKRTETSKVELFLQPFEEMYLHSNYLASKQTGGRITYVYLFSALALFILVIASINFINLSTAQSLRRAKEVGVRKAVGAGKGVLVGQFMTESLLVTCLSALMALGAVGLLLPQFNALTGKQMAMELHSAGFWKLFLSVTLLTGMLAGVYPAFFLASFQPIRVLKGAFRFNPQAALLRKGLVVFQFSLSVILIAGTLVIVRQTDFIGQKQLGMNRENLVRTFIGGSLTKNYALLRQELLQSSAIRSVSYCEQPLFDFNNRTSEVEWAGKPAATVTMFSYSGVGYDYTRTMGIDLKEGRDFSPDFPTDTASVLINEAAAKAMGLREPVGKTITIVGIWKRKIIGVMRNFHVRSLHQPIEPLFISLEPESPGWGEILVRTSPGQTMKAMEVLEKAYHKYNPGFPFRYTFADQTFGRLYQSETVMKQLAWYFAALAMLIACLGLLGLATFTAQQRQKEIGIRKVLGASVLQVVILLAGDFLKLVLLAVAIASPFAWYGMHRWLENFAYRVELEWWLFGLAALAALLVAFVTVSSLATRAALANPVKSLKTE
jgi:ABC-type antimicrobial peptide transport system permease subunit